MKKKYFLYAAICLLILVFLGAGAMLLYLKSGSRIFYLRNFDQAAYVTCRKLLNHPLVRSKDVEFFVYFGKDFFPKGFDRINAFSGGSFINGKPEFEHIIIFPSAVLKSGCLEVATAHELGHINLRTTDELAANIFAAEVLGSKKIVIDCLIKGGEPPDSERIVALSEKEENSQ